MRSTDKTQKIIQAAEEIISEKGLSGSNISEIAKRAGVTDSLIYNYFKGKEDLVFSIPGVRMKEFLKNLLEHLQGIPDPVGKLSKVLWFHLYFFDNHPEYTRLLLLECRSNREFYRYEAYSLIRQYAGIIAAILEEGVNEGIFRGDANMRLVRDIIFGVIDWETLESLALKETVGTTQDLQDILNLLIPMIQIRTPSEDLEKSSRILLAAEKVFGEKGYSQATISEIARLANVAEATIYEYFKNKEDLLFSIPEKRFREHIASLEEIFEIKTPLKKLQRLIRDHFYLYLRERDFLKVFLLHIQLNRRFFVSHVYETFHRYVEIVADILEEGKKDGSIRAQVNTRVFKNFFLGAFSHMALRWVILEKEAETDKMREIAEVVTLLCRAVASDTKDQK